MQLLMYRPSNSAVWADAMFASMLHAPIDPARARPGRPPRRPWMPTAAGGALSGWPRSSAITRRPRSRACAGLVGWPVRYSPHRRGQRGTAAENHRDYPLPACADGDW
jgi:hypothetical protein